MHWPEPDARLISAVELCRNKYGNNEASKIEMASKTRQKTKDQEKLTRKIFAAAEAWDDAKRRKLLATDAAQSFCMGMELVAHHKHEESIPVFRQALAYDGELDPGNYLRAVINVAV